VSICQRLLTCRLGNISEHSVTNKSEISSRRFTAIYSAWKLVLRGRYLIHCLCKLTTRQCGANNFTYSSVLQANSKRKSILVTALCITTRHSVWPRRKLMSTLKPVIKSHFAILKRGNRITTVALNVRYWLSFCKMASKYVKFTPTFYTVTNASELHVRNLSLWT
jgi:hypothetical protein